MWHSLKHIKRDWSKWSLFTVVLALLIVIPVFAIVIYLFVGKGEMWDHIVTYFLLDYILNSLILIIGTGVLTFLFGTSSAWIISQYEFPFRKTIDRLLFLPLAIPSYIVAYTYVGLFGNGGTIIALLQTIGIPIKKLEFMNIYGLIWVLSCSLFPYVYASARAMFMGLPKSIKESALLLGASHKRYFFSIALPLVSPAIIGGLFLVFMEVLNDFGAAKYYGVNTFTTGIFRSWTMLEDLQSAVYLSALLVVIVFIINGLISWKRGKKSYAIKGTNTEDKQSGRKKLQGQKRVFYLLVIAMPIFFGFILPIFQLFKWAVLTFNSVFNIEILWIALQSLSVALISAFLIIIMAFCLICFSRWNQIKFIKGFKKIATIGYIIPGAIIGIGVIRSSQSVINFFENTLHLDIGYLFYGSSIILVYAYIFRFLAVAYNPLEANSLKLGKHLSESSYLLGISKLKTFFKVEFPLLKNAILSSFLLVFIDLLKELPLTLILKPYKLKTLATVAYTYAEDERVAESALPALLLIGIITIIIFLLKFGDEKK